MMLNRKRKKKQSNFELCPKLSSPTFHFWLRRQWYIPLNLSRRVLLKNIYISPCSTSLVSHVRYFIDIGARNKDKDKFKKIEDKGNSIRYLFNQRDSISHTQTHFYFKSYWKRNRAKKYWIDNCGIGSKFRYFLSRAAARRRWALKVHVYRFRKRATLRYHPPAGKQLPTSCLGRFLCPALTFAFLSSPLYYIFSSFLPSIFLSCPLAAVAADRPRDAIRARREWDQDGGQVHPRLAAPDALVARALLLLSPLPPPLSLNAARYFIAACKSIKNAPHILEW